MAESHVYLLAHKELPLVKVGKANIIWSRADGLGLSDFDFLKSVGLRVASQSDAYALEHALHIAFSGQRIPAKKIREIVEHKSGHTEWFSSTCMELLDDALEKNKLMIPHERIDPSEKGEFWRRPAICLRFSEPELLILQQISEYTNESTHAFCVSALLEKLEAAEAGAQLGPALARGRNGRLPLVQLNLTMGEIGRLKAATNLSHHSMHSFCWKAVVEKVRGLSPA